MPRHWRIKDASNLRVQGSGSGKGFVFDNRTGYVYLLNKTGLHILKNLEEGKTVAQIANSMCSRFNLDRETAVRDAQEFLEALLREGWVDVGE